eukprot:CAMPEP_0205911374 /NCGR_PEP_ID=MMETSP1325-20131115/5109_1 /ASSEMBLY_ACC=CAM_ASM_000708 /TAXON_ID=236786 /ORGANISM="Florenciella sp., Strain RCC1007" /LENGTH=72 /DNA_ID=CAMNT_0053277893 /DNA_START=48 /DNA_END=262 /DNA_ORIENTATION=+
MAADVYDEVVNEAIGQGGGASEDAAEDFQQTFVSVKEGAYLVFRLEGRGKLEIVWSKSGRPDGAIAFFSTAV